MRIKIFVPLYFWIFDHGWHNYSDLMKKFNLKAPRGVRFWGETTVQYKANNFVSVWMCLNLNNRCFSRYVIAARLVDVNNRHLTSSFCSCTNICSFPRCYPCLWRLVADHIFPDNVIGGNFRLLFSRRRLRNVQSFKMHCSALFCQLDLLFRHVFVTVTITVGVCLRSLLFCKRRKEIHKYLQRTYKAIVLLLIKPLV